ncbi:hypothetical protein MLD38_037766 [Melastoma candidum]|uniref:Uncharacterized protein n=1 Tax=Melastoma candidum TaxID=119954 RepID=A0ACB9LNW9_9MYRT|nr:hypothetical protein MLD38_037766 [Melastoma candidum]
MGLIKIGASFLVYSDSIAAGNMIASITIDIGIAKRRIATTTMLVFSGLLFREAFSYQVTLSVEAMEM